MIRLVNNQVPKIVTEQLELHERVKFAVRDQALATQPDMQDVSRRLVDLRDEAAVAPAHDLPALLDQLNLHQSLANIDFKKKLPDMRSPYFAHLKIKENDGRVRDILIGHQTFLDTKHDISVIDWKNAPLAKIFFLYREGQEFFEQLPGREITGIILQRNVLTFEMGHLIAINSPSQNFRKDAQGQWLEDQIEQGATLSGGQGSANRGQTFGSGLGGQRMPDVSALLDHKQYQLLHNSTDEHLLILGGAGSGKTTVALHRIASLAAKNPRRFQAERMLVVVPDEGLVRLTRRILAKLHLDKVKVTSYDHWIMQTGRMILRSLPVKICEDTPAHVSLLKRHPAVLECFGELEAIRIGLYREQISKELSFVRGGPEIFSELKSKNLLDRIKLFEVYSIEQVKTSGLVASSKTHNLKQITKTIESMSRKLMNLDFDRLQLWSSQEIMDKAAKLTDGAINKSMVKELIRHTSKQFAEADSLLDNLPSGSEKIVSLDGIEVTEDADDGFVGTIDVEDYSVLLALLKFYTGKVRSPQAKLKKYRHLVIDEAQELTPIEFKILGDSIFDDATVTIAGDAAQQTDPTSSFTTWDHLLSQLNVGVINSTHLEVNYRSPKPIAEFAHQILGPLAPQNPPKAEREGCDVLVSDYSDFGHQALMLREALEELYEQEPQASCAIVCSDLDIARQYYDALSELPKIRLICKGEFSFSAGIDVTEVSQIKGLEFDYIVIPDANNQNYPITNIARRELHVASTRAMHQLWVNYVGFKSKVLPK
jgi:DNA helicase II / ATP-dependent DNA helicase PcrA